MPKELPIGFTSGNLTVVHKAEPHPSRGEGRSVVRCVCGQELIIFNWALSGKTPTKSCKKCVYKLFETRIPDRSGERFGRLVLLEKLKSTKRNSTYKVRCDCGKIYTTQLRTILHATSQEPSCGCKKNEDLAKTSRCTATKYRLSLGLDPNKHLTPTTLQERYIIATEITPLVLKRDGYKCLLCGTRKNLCAHHLLGYRNFPIWRKDPRNLVTVCRICHLEIVHKYNTRNPPDSIINAFLAWRLSRILFSQVFHGKYT